MPVLFFYFDVLVSQNSNKSVWKDAKSICLIVYWVAATMLNASAAVYDWKRNAWRVSCNFCCGLRKFFHYFSIKIAHAVMHVPTDAVVARILFVNAK